MITQEQLSLIAKTIQANTLDESMMTTLRSQNPGVHFTYCMEDDIPNLQPVLESSGFNLYLIDGREHCLKLTSDYQDATGVVVAEVIDA